MISSLLFSVVLVGSQTPPKKASLIKQNTHPVAELTLAQKQEFLKKTNKNFSTDAAVRIVTLDSLHLTDPVSQASMRYGADGNAWLDVEGDSPGEIILSGACAVHVVAPITTQSASYLVVLYGNNQRAPLSYTVNGVTTNVPPPADSPVPVVITVPAFSFNPPNLPYSPYEVVFSTSGPPGEANYFLFQRVTIQKVTI